MLLSRPEPAKKKGNRLLHRVIPASGALAFSASDGIPKDANRFEQHLNVPLFASSLLRARQNKLEGSALFLSLKKRIDVSDIQLRNSTNSHPLKTAVNC